jgi:PfaD family protein
MADRSSTLVKPEASRDNQALIHQGLEESLWQIGLPVDNLPNGAVPVPALDLASLGDPNFIADHRLKYAYVAGAMANGIGSVRLVKALGAAGMLGFFGSAGLPLKEVESAIGQLQHLDFPFGFNLIHSPNEPDLEAAVVDLYLRRGIRLVEASAYLDLTLPVVRYRVHGLHVDASGQIVAPNRIIAKVSRVELASKFFAPPPLPMLRHLVGQGEITEHQAELARRIPMAQDLTAEADSAGHTDNRPSLTLLPTLVALRDRLQAQYEYLEFLRVGAAGGISTPASAAAALAMGAAYVVTGSVNQACVESGSSDLVREMLAQAEQADTMMAPAADMFEMGVKVQVLKRGTMFPMRAAKLYELYRTYPSLDDIPNPEKSVLEKSIFRSSLDDIWNQTKSYFLGRDSSQVDRANREPKHKMALIFRWYLGQSSRWANQGDPFRKIDFQVWCGPAMGAFNEWTKGSYLEEPRNRHVAPVALNILYGAAVLLRATHLRIQGVRLPPYLPRVTPISPSEIEMRMQGTEA